MVKSTPNEIRSKEDLKAHLIRNKFDWLKDGINKDKELEFKHDGTYT